MLARRVSQAFSAARLRMVARSVARWRVWLDCGLWNTTLATSAGLRHPAQNPVSPTPHRAGTVLQIEHIMGTRRGPVSKSTSSRINASRIPTPRAMCSKYPAGVVGPLSATGAAGCAALTVNA
jgi:hypothetical protein